MEGKDLTFSELRGLLDKRAAFYRDEYMPVKSLRMNSINGTIVQTKSIAGEIVVKEFELLPWGMQTMCCKLGIPYSYAKKCPPQLRASNFNYWLEAHRGGEFFVRLDGYPDSAEKIRAVLSKKYAETLKYLNEAIENNPKDIVNFRHKAIILNMVKKYEKALESINEAIKGNQNDLEN